MAILEHYLDTNRTLKRKNYRTNYPITQFKGLYGDRTNSVVDGHLFSELLETRSSTFDFKIAPHVHPGLYQIFFITEGTLEFHEPSDKQALNAPCIILIPPTVLHAKETVKNVAVKLGITTVHLNRICNTVAGKSAGQMMDEHLIEESKKYLSYTSYSISEIAYLLKFDYPNYFARFFKKNTGVTPLQFRKQ